MGYTIWAFNSSCKWQRATTIRTIILNLNLVSSILSTLSITFYGSSLKNGFKMVNLAEVMDKQRGLLTLILKLPCVLSSERPILLELYLLRLWLDLALILEVQLVNQFDLLFLIESFQCTIGYVCTWEVCTMSTLEQETLKGAHNFVTSQFPLLP